MSLGEAFAFPHEGLNGGGPIRSPGAFLCPGAHLGAPWSKRSCGVQMLYVGQPGGPRGLGWEPRLT